MRTLFYWLIVLSFFGAGAWLMMNKDSNKPYEIPYLSKSSMGLSFGSLMENEVTILPLEEWESVLTNGEWDFTTVFYGIDDIHRFEGDVEFKTDGTFNRYVTMSYYRGTAKKVQENERYLKSVSGGSISGKWGIAVNGEPFWFESVEKCNGKVSFKSPTITDPKHICDAFGKGKLYTYGTKKEDLAKYEVTTFKNDHIVIEGKSYADEGKRVWIFYKGED